MCKKVIIIGGGGHARVIADCVLKSGDCLLGFLDDNLPAGEEILGFPVLGNTASFDNYPEAEFIIGIGNAGVRETIAEKLKDVRFYTAIHPTAVIGLGVTIGEGSCVLANAVVNAGAVVGKHCILNTASVVEHDNKLSDFVHISPTAALAGTVTVGKSTHIGAGAKVRNNIDICADVTVGVGGVVVRSITESGVYVGVPAGKVR